MKKILILFLLVSASFSAYAGLAVSLSASEYAKYLERHSDSLHFMYDAYCSHDSLSGFKDFEAAYYNDTIKRHILSLTTDTAGWLKALTEIRCRDDKKDRLDRSRMMPRINGFIEKYTEKERDSLRMAIKKDSALYEVYCDSVMKRSENSAYNYYRKSYIEKGYFRKYYLEQAVEFHYPELFDSLRHIRLVQDAYLFSDIGVYDSIITGMKIENSGDINSLIFSSLDKKRIHFLLRDRSESNRIYRRALCHLLDKTNYIKVSESDYGTYDAFYIDDIWFEDDGHRDYYFESESEFRKAKKEREDQKKKLKMVEKLGLDSLPANVYFLSEFYDYFSNFGIEAISETPEETDYEEHCHNIVKIPSRLDGVITDMAGYSKYSFKDNYSQERLEKYSNWIKENAAEIQMYIEKEADEMDELFFKRNMYWLKDVSFYEQFMTDFYSMKLREKLRRINKDTDFKLSERAKAFASKVLEKNNDLEVAKAVISAVEKEEETMKKTKEVLSGVKIEFSKPDITFNKFEELYEKAMSILNEMTTVMIERSKATYELWRYVSPQPKRHFFMFDYDDYK
jgi:hypothetical protein